MVRFHLVYLQIKINNLLFFSGLYDWGLRGRFLIVKFFKFLGFLPTVCKLYCYRNRQTGKTALWNPGCDHAGIATQVHHDNISLRRTFNGGWVSLGCSRSRSLIKDHSSDHCASNEPKDPCPEWIHWFL